MEIPEDEWYFFLEEQWKSISKLSKDATAAEIGQLSSKALSVPSAMRQKASPAGT
jgi:hypothetical protein